MHIRFRPISTISALCLLFVVPVTGFASETDRNSLHAGAWALQFRITDNFTLGNFNGTLLSVKRHTSDKSAFRAGVSFTLQNTDTEQTTEQTTILNRKESRDTYSTRIDLQYLGYPSPKAAVNLFLGAGPFFSYNRYKTDQTEPVDAGQLSKAWYLGLGTVLGVEWFPFRSVGLHAEYGLSFSYGSTKVTTDTSGTNPAHTESTMDTWSIAGDSVLLGLSVYF